MLVKTAKLLASQFKTIDNLAIKKIFCDLLTTPTSGVKTVVKLLQQIIVGYLLLLVQKNNLTGDWTITEIKGPQWSMVVFYLMLYKKYFTYKKF
ncbi:hypothetical protein [Spiroplasma endosymbiont of Polydrusus formosus]|uniref:hypothetical protein n=1 Tax=Spiroplasma endosymbiont of Polydrusus formosus TaxID=3139326 RepID=UPI0035B506C7